MPPMMRVIEESSAMTRICFTFLGCANMRPLKLHYYGANNVERCAPVC